MTTSTVTRQDVADLLVADAKRGYRNGTGYPGASPNRYCKYFGFGTTYSCAFGVSWAFAKAGLPLPSMEPGMAHGYYNCVDGLNYFKRHRAVKSSWEAQVADPLFINTGGGSQPGHTELVYAVTGSGAQRKVYSVGADSGPSNINGYAGQGGTHLHVWACPEGVGNPAIMAVGDAGKVVAFSTANRQKVSRKARRYRPIHKDAEGKVTVMPSELRHHQRTLWRRLRVLVRKNEGKVKGS